MYNQKQPAYAPTTFTFPQTSSLAATINLDEVSSANRTTHSTAQLLTLRHG
jgi:hypothetical protein